VNGAKPTTPASAARGIIGDKLTFAAVTRGAFECGDWQLFMRLVANPRSLGAQVSFTVTARWRAVVDGAGGVSKTLGSLPETFRNK